MAKKSSSRSATARYKGSKVRVKSKPKARSTKQKLKDTRLSGNVGGVVSAPSKAGRKRSPDPKSVKAVKQMKRAAEDTRSIPAGVNKRNLAKKTIKAVKTAMAPSKARRAKRAASRKKK